MGSQCSFIPAMRLNAQPQLKDDAGYTYRKGSKGKDGMYFFYSVWAHGTDILICIRNGLWILFLSLESEQTRCKVAIFVI